MDCADVFANCRYAAKFLSQGEEFFVGVVILFLCIVPGRVRRLSG